MTSTIKKSAEPYFGYESANITKTTDQSDTWYGGRVFPANKCADIESISRKAHVVATHSPAQAPGRHLLVAPTARRCIRRTLTMVLMHGVES